MLESLPAPSDTMSESTLRELCGAGVVDVVVDGLKGGGLAIKVRYGIGDGRTEKLLGTTRGGIRKFGSIDSAGALLRDLGLQRFSVDLSRYEPGRVRGPRPDRSEALKKTRTSPQQGSLLL